MVFHLMFRDSCDSLYLESEVVNKPLASLQRHGLFYFGTVPCLSASDKEQRKT